MFQLYEAMNLCVMRSLNNNVNNSIAPGFRRDQNANHIEVEPSFHFYQTSAVTSSPHHLSAMRGIPGLVATSAISDISDRGGYNKCCPFLVIQGGQGESENFLKLVRSEWKVARGAFSNSSPAVPTTSLTLLGLGMFTV